VKGQKHGYFNYLSYNVEWKKLHIEELNDLYSSPNIVGVIKSRIMRWAGHVTHMGEGRVQGFVGEV
jgi:hypothetical protein